MDLVLLNSPTENNRIYNMWCSQKVSVAGISIQSSSIIYSYGKIDVSSGPEV